MVVKTKDGLSVAKCGEQKDRYNECPNEALELHPCPYYEDNDPHCNCCENCQFECAQDI